jgi:hypothetical protein
LAIFFAAKKERLSMTTTKTKAPAKGNKSSKTPGLTSAVHVAACLRRDNTTIPASVQNKYGYKMRKIWVDEDGNLAADAGCSSVFIAAPGEIGDIVAFLNQVATGMKKAA